MELHAPIRIYLLIEGRPTGSEGRARGKTHAQAILRLARRRVDPLSRTHGDLVKVFGWYDNEWGYTNRLLDLTSYLAARPPRS